MKTFVVLRRSVYRAAVAVLPAPVMLTVLVGTIFFKPKPIGWFRSSDSFPLTVPIVYPLFMNRIITGDERNVKNLETKVYMVYVLWGMSFNDGQIPSQKVNPQYTLLSAGNVTYAIRQPSERRIWSWSHPPLAVHRCYANLKHIERRIWSGTLPHGKFEAAHCRTANCQLYIYPKLITSTFPISVQKKRQKGVP